MDNSHHGCVSSALMVITHVLLGARRYAKHSRRSSHYIFTSVAFRHLDRGTVREPEIDSVPSSVQVSPVPKLVLFYHYNNSLINKVNEKDNSTVWVTNENDNRREPRGCFLCTCGLVPGRERLIFWPWLQCTYCHQVAVRYLGHMSQSTSFVVFLRFKV